MEYRLDKFYEKSRIDTTKKHLADFNAIPYWMSFLEYLHKYKYAEGIRYKN